MTWTLDDALRDVRALNPLLSEVGYCIALTGGVLFRGESGKDVDFILYPLQDVREYSDALRVVRSFYGDAPIVRVPHPTASKLVYTISGPRRVDVFVIGQLCADTILTTDQIADYAAKKEAA